jgi:hypothetical protein
MSEQGKTNWADIKLGAVWGPKQTKSGKERFGGTLKVSQLKKFVSQMTEEEKAKDELTIQIFPNTSKKQQNHPDMEIYRSEPMAKKDTVKTTDSWGSEADNVM